MKAITKQEDQLFTVRRKLMDPIKIQSSPESINPNFDFVTVTPDEIQKEAEEIKKENPEITGESLLNRKITEIPFLVGSLLQRSGIGCLAGPSDVGKSMLLRMLAITIVTKQKTFLGFPLLCRHFNAIYVSSEDQENETAFLLLKQSRGYLAEDFKGLRFVFETTDLLEKLDRMLTTAPADLIIIDCFADSFGSDLKDTQKIRTFLHPYQELAAKHDTLILFLHHTAKRTENLEPNKNNLLAGQGFEAKMRLVIELRSDLTNPTHRHLCIVKGNYLPAHMKRESFVLEFLEDCFLFRDTGERMPYELLSKPTEDNSKAKYEQAKVLRDQGLTLDQIAKKLGYAGKGTVSKILAKGEASGWNEGFQKVSNGNHKETTEVSMFPSPKEMETGNLKSHPNQSKNEGFQQTEN